jgi:hypothetical protein
VLVAATAAFLVAIGGVGLEIGNAYMTHTQNQRVADIAAFAGASAYMANINSTTAMTAAVQRIMALAGLGTGAANATVVTSPSGDGNSAVKVQVTTSVPLALVSMIDNSVALSVHATSYAEVGNAGQACIIGLATSGNSVLEDGGATVSGTGCAVAGVKNITIQGGSHITALGLYAGGTVTNNSSTITTTPTANNINQNVSGITDPVASNGAVSMAFSTVASLNSSNPGNTVSAPTGLPSGTALSFSWSPSGPSDPTYPYYSGTGGVYNKGTLACTPYSSISVGGGISVRISAASSCAYTVTGNVANNGTLLEIDGAASSWTIGGSVTVGGGEAMSLGGATNTVWIGGGLTIGGGSTFTLGPSNTVQIAGGISSGGSSISNLTAAIYQVAGTVTLSGTFNWNTTGSSASTKFYTAPVTLGSGGGTFTFGSGNYYFYNSSISNTLTLSSGPTYFNNALLLIYGNITVSSGASLCGTPAPCSSGTSTMTVVSNGTHTFSGGSTSYIVAPAAGATYGIPGIAFAGNYAGAAGTYPQNFDGGTNGTWGGVIYFPNSGLEFNGGASTTGAGGCFELIASVVYLTGGTTTATTCSGFAASVSSSTVAKLVQ